MRSPKCSLTTSRGKGQWKEQNLPKLLEKEFKKQHRASKKAADEAYKIADNWAVIQARAVGVVPGQFVLIRPTQDSMVWHRARVISVGCSGHLTELGQLAWKFTVQMIKKDGSRIWGRSAQHIRGAYTDTWRLITKEELCQPLPRIKRS